MASKWMRLGEGDDFEGRAAFLEQRWQAIDQHRFEGPSGMAMANEAAGDIWLSSRSVWALRKSLAPAKAASRYRLPHALQDAVATFVAWETLRDAEDSIGLFMQAPAVSNREKSSRKSDSRITSEDFRAALNRMFVDARARGAIQLDVNAGDLHRIVGVYPEKGHSMPSCCRVMRQLMGVGDAILHAPPKGDGASVTIRYKIDR